MPSKLEEIVIQRRQDVASAQGITSESALEERSQLVENELGPPLNLLEAIRTHQASFDDDGREMFVAAEFKRASPSKGDFLSAEEMKVLSVGEQASKYAGAGAGLISVLTEPKWFKGSLEDMLSARRSVNSLKAHSGSRGGSSRPLVLRKDFIIDKYQLLEARAFGADSVLLMLSILSEQECALLIARARTLGMEPLVEVVNEEETLAALRSGAKVLGVNNRNLHTFVVDMQTTPRVVQVVREQGATDRVAVLALSGIKTRSDVQAYEQFGHIAGLLVGEALMTTPDPARMISLLVRDDKENDGMIQQNGSDKAVRVKVCGINSCDAALAAARAGADFIGLIFVQKSVRCCSVDKAKEIVSAIQAFREMPGKSVVIPKPQAVAKDHDDKNEWFQSWSQTLGRTCNGQARPLVVGVFMNHPMDEVNSIAKETGIDLIQLHGNETKDDEEQCTLPAIRVVHVDSKATAEHGVSPEDMHQGPAAMLLLDTSVKGVGTGGTGQTFDWAIAERLRQEKRLPLIMAGGLTPDNVAEAVGVAHPWGVDVASGVESAPGQKDHDKIRAFVKAAKGRS